MRRWCEVHVLGIPQPICWIVWSRISEERGRSSDCTDGVSFWCHRTATAHHGPYRTQVLIRLSGISISPTSGIQNTWDQVDDWCWLEAARVNINHRPCLSRMATQAPCQMRLDQTTILGLRRVPTSLSKVMERIGSQKSVTRNSLTANRKMNFHSELWVQPLPEQL